MTVEEAISKLMELPPNYKIYLHKSSDCEITEFSLEGDFVQIEADCFCGYSYE